MSMVDESRDLSTPLTSNNLEEDFASESKRVAEEPDNIEKWKPSRTVSEVSVSTPEPWDRPPVFEPTTGIAPKLSQGKRYHAFFSYDIGDRDWVIEVIERLESPELGFRCSAHERDFHGGKRITENIPQHIRESEKTVFVLSPSFLKSQWCQLEVTQGLAQTTMEGRMLLLPVMIKKCQIPGVLRTVPCVDATGPDWFERFKMAITDRATLQSDFTTRHFTIQSQDGNMTPLAEVITKHSCPTTEEANNIDPLLPDALTKPGIERKSRLRKAMVKINNIVIERNVIAGVQVSLRVSCVLCSTKAKAKQVIIEHSAAYTSAYLAGSLKPSKGRRHVEHAYCLCQFIEHKYTSSNRWTQCCRGTDVTPYQV